MANKSESPASKQLLEEVGLSNLPHEWGIVRVEELLSDDRGISVGVMYPGSHDPCGVPLIKSGDLTNNIIPPQPPFKITRAKHIEYKRTALEGGELLLSLVGDVGRCAVVPSKMADWNVARAIAVLRFKESLNAGFVRSCLLSAPIQHLMHAWSTTTVQATLNLKEIRQIPLPWPGEDERKRIAEIIGELDDKIELNRKMNETLEAMARALFKSWFVNFDPVRAITEGRETGLPEAVAAIFPDSFEDTEYGEVPTGWPPVPLTDLIAVNPTRSLSKGVIAPYLDMANIPISGHSPDEVIDRPYGSGMRFMNGDTLVARITPCLENGKTAFVDFLKDGQIGWGSTEYIVLRPKNPLPEEFAYCLARSKDFRKFAIQSMTGSSGRQRVPADSLSHFTIAKPNKEVAVQFGRLVKPIFQRAREAAEESRTLAFLRDALLPKLISGEIRLNSKGA